MHDDLTLILEAEGYADDQTKARHGAAKRWMAADLEALSMFGETQADEAQSASPSISAKRSQEMGKAALPLVLLLMAYVLVEGVTLYKTKHRFDPLYIYDQFLETNRAVEKCGNPEKDRLEQYQRNLRSVADRAREKIQERNPTTPAESIDQMITSRRQAREGEIDAIIKAGGCADPQIKTLLKRFEIQARVRAG